MGAGALAVARPTEVLGLQDPSSAGKGGSQSWVAGSPGKS